MTRIIGLPIAAVAALFLLLCLVLPEPVTVAAKLSAEPRELVERDVYLMGTRARLVTYQLSRADGLAVLERAVQVLEATEEELSTWRRDSAVSALNRQPVGAPWRASDGLCRMFAGVYELQARTRGTFDPAVGRLLEAWDVHGSGRVPSPAELARARRLSGLNLLTFDRRHCVLTRTADVAVDVGAFGKGEGLDRAAATLGPGPWMIDLGGQISVGGPPPDARSWSVAIAHPLDRGQPYLRVSLAEGSLSTSAGSESDFDAGGTRIGHILDPRTGRPAPFRGSVTVWHRSGLVADALSTALYVMGPGEGLQWAERQGLSACFLIAEGDTIRLSMTRAFAALVASS